MVLAAISEVLLGIYLGLLAGLFPALIAFAMGFGFKYLTDVTVPGFGVVVLAGALAGITGGLMGLVDPALARGWTGISAVLVILMLSLWAHAQGDKLAAETPKRWSLTALANADFSANIVNLVDAYGQVRVRPIGEVEDLEGYPPLPDEVREQIAAGTWRFPAKLSRTEIEHRLEERLVTDHDLAEATVTLDARGRAEIAAAPTIAGLSRRLPTGTRAVSVRTLLPTGMARGDRAAVQLPDGEIQGPVVSARTTAPEPAKPSAPPPDPEPAEPAADADEEAPPRPRSPTTRGGRGQLTIALEPEDAKRLLSADRAPMHVEARGKQREFEVLETLQDAGNQFRRVQLPEEHPLVGETLGKAKIRDRYGVAVLAIRRPGERLVAPGGATTLRAGDALTVVGPPSALDGFEAEVGA